MWTPDTAYVISMSWREDRRASLAPQLARLSFPVTVFTGLDGRLLPRPANFAASAQTLGCAFSHRVVLRQSRGTALILEDDAQLPTAFQRQVGELLAKLPPHWDLVKLGGEHLAPPIPVAPGVVRCVQTARTHAYLVRGLMRQRLIDIIDTTNWHWDAPYSLEPAYAPDPFLVGTDGSPSDIPDSRALA